MTVFPCVLKRTKPQLILSNGSERGDFAPVGQIQSAMGRIHDGMQVLKTYYPHNPKWSSRQRISETKADADVGYQWDYEYEDYHPFNLLEPDGDCAGQFAEIKRFGSDIHLTLTLDLALSDDEIEAVVRSLRPYGRIFLRINHECNGNWFRYNKFYSYKEVGDFFVRCHRIVKANSSQIFTVFCLSGDFFAKRLVVEDMFLRLGVDELREALETADYWSVDRYTSLHFAWPFAKTCNRADPSTYFDNSVDDWWRIIEETYLGMIWHNGMKMKPLFLNEFNTDADVNGFERQAENVASVYERIQKSDLPWLAGIAFYQFRDRGGLGLELGDNRGSRPNPSLAAYRNGIHGIGYTFIVEDWQEWPNKSFIFAWANSDSVRGLCLRGIQGRVELENRFGVPIYLVDEAQRWLRLEPGERGGVAAERQAYLFVPPFAGGGGRLDYSLKVDDLRPKLQAMLGAPA